MIRWSPFGWLVLATALGAQSPAPVDPRSVLADPTAAADERCLALARLQDAGGLDVPTVLAAMNDADDALGAAAAAIVRHEWAVLPEPLLAGLDAAPVAARRFLYELAQAPRPAAQAWLATAIAKPGGRGPDDRCLALAARGTPLSAAETDELLRTVAAGEAGDGFLLAARLVPPAVADGIAGRLHASLERGQFEVDQVVPLLDRMSPTGCRSLLALVATLPLELARQLGQRLAERDVTLVHERAAAMLDGSDPLEVVWLDHAGPLLDSPARIGRVLQVLADANAPAVLRQSAFDALLAARIVDERVLAFATAEDASPSLASRLLSAAIDRIPGRDLADWLGSSPELATATVRALGRRSPLGADVEAALQRLLLDGEWVEGAFFEPAAMAIVQHGSEAVLDVVWPHVRGASSFAELVDALSRRREPFVHELLLDELAAEAPAAADAVQLDERRDVVRLALVAIGDRRQLATLVAHGKDRSPTFVRRCAHWARPLDAANAVVLLDDAAKVADADLALEMTAWAATSNDPAIAERLWQLRAAPATTLEAEARRDLAVRALATGPFRDRLQAELRTAIAEGPVPPHLESLQFELVASTAAPLAAADVRFLADLLLLPPLTDPAFEVQQRERWPDGRFGFPLVAAIAQRLRGADVDLLRTTFAAAVADVMQDPRRAAMSRQRLLVLWRSLEADRAALAAVAVPLAPLLLQLPDAGGAGEGPAHWFCMQAAEAAGDFPAAAAHARTAIGSLLRLPAERRTARLFLGEREPGSGRDPWAALAAAPHRFALAAALASGDAAAAATARALVHEFAGHDTGSLASLPTTTQRDPLR